MNKIQYTYMLFLCPYFYNCTLLSNLYVFGLYLMNTIGILFPSRHMLSHIFEIHATSQDIEYNSCWNSLTSKCVNTQVPFIDDFNDKIYKSTCVGYPHVYYSTCSHISSCLHELHSSWISCHKFTMYKNTWFFSNFTYSLVFIVYTNTRSFANFTCIS